MTPDEAAAALGVDRDADSAEIDRAYRRLARELHPDRYTGRPADEVRAASDRFIEVTRAHDVLLAAPRRPAPSARIVVERPPADATRPETAHRRPFGWWLFAAWTALTVVGAILSTATGPLFTPADLWVRLGLLIAFALATALTGRRWVWRITLVLLGLSAIAVIASTTVAGLLGLGFMAIACFGLAVQGRLVRFPDQ
ncbi:J domain-containing protein [Agromyces indicus]|uniref:J domain-containing protein n=1 Tax=Agromyces indicus TaxID=758919 RepID=A0ABU1FND6_9MICO|nr:J domain-containing protein [Agromyces indicus]MDR5693260.1 J domain-containing protein [Agromyces indicus]